jgi:hypothetical protein
MKHASLSLVALASVLLIASSAAAEEKQTSASAAGRVITLKVTDVYGRVQRPAAAVEVSKVRMQLPATTPTLAAVAKIHDAARKDPF